LVSVEPRDTLQQRLVGCLESPFPEVRRHGARRTGELGDGELSPLLAPLLRDAQPTVRREAARALGRLGAEEVVEDLLELLEDPDPGVALDAAWALGCIGGPGGEALVEDPGELVEPPGRARWSPPAGGASAKSGSSRRYSAGVEVFALVALLGFGLGRYLPSLQVLLGGVPTSSSDSGKSSRDRAQARALLFPGQDVVSRIGIGASLALDQDPDGLRLLSRAMDDFLFPNPGGSGPRSLRLEGQVLGPRSDLVEDPWPEASPTPAASPTLAVNPRRKREGTKPVAAVPTQKGKGRRSELRNPEARQAPKASSQMPLDRGALAGVEHDLYRVAARRYLEAGDRRQALELLSMATGRDLKDADLERILLGRGEPRAGATSSEGR
jgi:hypothetical protein